MTVIGRESVVKKLSQVLGEKRALELVRETMADAQLRAIASADDQLAFANALIPRGGVLEAVGRALKIQAILNGAHEGSGSIRP